VNAPVPVKSLWRSAQLLLAFHKTKEGARRNEPVMWRPNDATARLPDDPEDKEAFVNVRGDGDAHDVQIKMHPDKLVLRRDPEEVVGWSGIIADHDEVRVKVGETWILVRADGSVQRRTDGAEDTTWIEADGSFIRIGPETEIMVSGDGSKLSRRTESQIDAITADGVVSRRK
jgi:hypothetical protein